MTGFALVSHPNPPKTCGIALVMTGFVFVEAGFALVSHLNPPTTCGTALVMTGFSRKMETLPFGKQRREHRLPS